MLRQMRERDRAEGPAVPQDAELFLLSGSSPQTLAAAAAAMGEAAGSWDAPAFALAARETTSRALQAQAYRAAITAANPAELSSALAAIAGGPNGETFQTPAGAFVGHARERRSVVFAFPHSAGAEPRQAGLWQRRFRESRESVAGMRAHARLAADAFASSGIAPMAASYAGWRLLERCNVRPSAVMGAGHGAILACAAAGVIDEEDVAPLAVAVAEGQRIGEVLRDYAFADPEVPLYFGANGLQISSGDGAKAALACLPDRGAGFDGALAALEPDLLIEIGCGSALAAKALGAGRFALSIKAHDGPIRGLLSVIGAAFARGMPVNAAALYEDRRLPGGETPVEGGIFRPMPVSTDTFLSS